MKDWIHKKETERLDLLRLVSGKTNLPDFMLEKDWWVTTALEAIFTCDLHKHFAFKGGTSLSKSWNLLNRFSEDIDIVIDKSLFGVTDDQELGISQREKLRDAAHAFVMKTVQPMLHARMLMIGVPESTFKIYAEESKSSDQDPTIILLDYNSITEIKNDYTKAQVKIEIGVRAMMEPFEDRPVSSLLSQQLNTNEVVGVSTVLPQRTFWEKSFLLHELFQKPLDKMEIARMSRHWYDLHYLAQAGFGEKAMQDKALFEAIRNHRKIFTKVPGVDYDALSPKTFGLFPPKEKEAEWNGDYKKMIESYIYRDAPSLEILSGSIKELTEEFKKLDY
ncbi:MAG TPA: nucleotidyl transferase AbiEii/AbiGii toxin family protein [Saprospiraceae bacterium]|nr:nucleotidyl transferase AbiEii/AbiGii toxin family protein [Saprospiraceae bacterium]